MIVRHPARGLRSLINLKSGEAISGVVARQRGGHLMVLGAQLHEPGAEPTPIEGTAVVPLENIAWIQTG